MARLFHIRVSIAEREATRPRPEMSLNKDLAIVQVVAFHFATKYNCPYCSICSSPQLFCVFLYLRGRHLNQGLMRVSIVDMLFQETHLVR